jgi:hypothetical protein
MTIADATTRRDAHPAFGRHISDAWLAHEAAKRRGLWHPFYDWLEAPAGHSDSDAVVEAIDAALMAPIHGAVVSRAKRLRADRADFWSAVGELYMSAQLASCGLHTTLGNPDIRVASRGDAVDIEVNAIHATHDLTRLQEMIAGRLGRPGTVIIWCPDERTPIDLDTAESITSRTLALAASSASAPLLEHEVLGPDETGREVAISDLVGPETLRVFVQEGDPGYVASRTGPRTGLVDPWPGLMRRVREKLPQLAGTSCGVVAVEAGFSHASSIIWAERAALGHGTPVLRTEPDVAGLLIYWLDLRRHRPWRSYFVPNVDSACTKALLLRDVLLCLGAVAFPVVDDSSPSPVANGEA